MFTRATFHGSWIAAALGFAAAIFAHAAPAQSTLPMAVHQGLATYITGGIGDDEVQVMKASASSYNLQISNSENDGHFTAGMDIVIRDGRGQEALRVQNIGPLFYVQLAPGDYTVDATFNGVERVREVSLPARGAVTVNLIWPEMEIPR
jgi:hypothetical protein